MQHLTFRSSRIIYYGPHACENCGVSICKMAHEFGGNAFSYPEGPIYPNTEWHPHVCDPKRTGHRNLIAGLREQHLKAVATGNRSGMIRLGWRVDTPDSSGRRVSRLLTEEEIAEITAPVEKIPDEPAPI